MSLRVEELAYRPFTADVFAHLANRTWSAWLDSGRPGCGRGRWDILVCHPRLMLVTRGELTRTWGEKNLLSRADPLDLLRKGLGRTREGHSELPFCGGAVGWFGYDLGRRFETLPSTAADRQGLPDMVAGIYDWAFLTDHQEGRSFLVGRDGSSPRSRRLLAEAVRSPLAPARGRFQVLGELRSSLSDADYRERFARVKSYIEAGDCYQVNLTRRFSVPAEGDPYLAYLELRRRNPAPFAAYLRAPGVCVLSASPERFLSVRGREVETCPIKGTIERGAEPETDQRRRHGLLASAKDRAENLMIVDLLRNDLGRSCAPGSIRVPSLFEVQSFADVHHLVSRVTGRLAPGVDALHLLRGCFPGGSVTGAPKIRAMEIIEELEGERRSVYCGSIGYVGFDGAMDTNIAIRTMVHAGGELCYWAGGGIVADSSPAAEMEEVAVKARAMREVAEAFRSGGAAGAGPQLVRVRGR